MYSNLNVKTMAGMKPTAIKLYQFAASRTLPATLGVKDFQRMCGVDPSVPGWSQEAEQACRELVSAGVARVAYVHEDVIHLE
jgi:hypothetical protein